MNVTNNSDKMSGEAERVVQMILTVFIFVVGITLNSLVIWVLGVRRSRHSGSIGAETQGAGSFRVYVVNLAVADLVLVLRTPLMLGYLAHHYNWPFGVHVCRLIMCLRCLGLYAGAFLLSAVALERCLCLLRPVWARLRRPRWVVPLVCSLLWVMAIALSIPYITAAGLDNISNRIQCVETVNGTNTGPTLIVLETTAGFLLPLVLFLSCNIAILLGASRMEKGVAVATTPVSSPTSPSAPVYPSQRLSRLYRLLFLTMLLFLTCWVPYFTCRFIRALTANKKGWEKLYFQSIKGSYVALFLVYLKSALNPILYVFAARGLRRTLRASLLSTIERVFNEEVSESLRRKSLRRRDSQF